MESSTYIYIAGFIAGSAIIAAPILYAIMENKKRAANAEQFSKDLASLRYFMSIDGRMIAIKGSNYDAHLSPTHNSWMEDAEELEQELETQSNEHLAQRASKKNGEKLIGEISGRLQLSGKNILFNDLRQLLREQHNINTPAEFAALSDDERTAIEASL